METKKNYQKPEFIEVEMKIANVVMASCGGSTTVEP